MLNQIGIDNRIEEKGVDAVIHMVVHVIVGPVRKHRLINGQFPRRGSEVKRGNRPSRSIFLVKEVVGSLAFLEGCERHSKNVQ